MNCNCVHFVFNEHNLSILKGAKVVVRGPAAKKYSMYVYSFSTKIIIFRWELSNNRGTCISIFVHIFIYICIWTYTSFQVQWRNYVQFFFHLRWRNIFPFTISFMRRNVHFHFLVKDIWHCKKKLMIKISQLSLWWNFISISIDRIISPFPYIVLSRSVVIDRECQSWGLGCSARISAGGLGRGYIIYLCEREAYFSISFQKWTNLPLLHSQVTGYLAQKK